MEAASASSSSIFSSSTFVDISELDDYSPCPPSPSAAATGTGNVDSVPSFHCARSPSSFMIVCCGGGSSYEKPAGAAAETRFFSDDRTWPPQHFLDACFLCKRRITMNSDIFMYRGDAPFCSEEYREEQMEMDRALERVRRHHCMISSSSSSSSSSTAAAATIATIKNRTIDKNTTGMAKHNRGGVISTRRSPTINFRAGTAALVSG